MKIHRIALIVVLGTAAAVLPAQTRAPEAGVMLQAALHQETVNGNLDSAITLYRRVAEDRRADRATVAMALVSLGRAYEALGSAEARKAYERVVRDFADQTSQAGMARARLASISQNGKRVAAAGPVARRLWDGRQVDLMGAASPDGRQLTFVDWDTGELAVRDLVAGSNRNLTASGPWSVNNDYSETSIWSRDGKQVAFTWYTNDDVYEMRLVRAEGGPPRTLFRNADVDYFWADDWSPDGRHILAILRRNDKSNQMALMSAADGSIRVLKTFDWRWPMQMSFSPDGRWIAYDFPPVEQEPERDIYVLATDGSRETVVMKHPANDQVLGWTRDGSGILFTTTRRGATDIAFLPMRGGEVRGEMQVVKADAGPISPLGFVGDAFYYGARHGGSDVYFGTLDFASGRIVAEPSRMAVRVEGRNHHPAWSPDGKQLAWIEEPSATGAPRTIAIRNLQDGAERRLPVLNFLRLFELHWSPDQKAIFMLGNNRKDGIGIFRLDLASGQQKVVVASVIEEGTLGRRPDSRMFALTPDGRTLVYSITGTSDKFPPRIVAHDLVSDTSRVIHSIPFQTGTMMFYGLVLSPDGRELAFGLIDGVPTKSAGIYVMPVNGGTAREVARHNQWVAPVAWIDDGRTILYEVDPPATLVGRQHSHEVWRVSRSGGQATRLDIALDALVNLRLHPDGKRFAFAYGQVQSEVWVLENALPKRASAGK